MRETPAMRLLLAAIACLACFNAAHANEFYEAGQRHHTDKARAQTERQLSLGPLWPAGLHFALSIPALRPRSRATLLRR
jgi:hypothetical protein